MNTIQCHIGDSDYRLDYDGSRITSGWIFHGTVFMEHIVDFYCEVPDDGETPLFSPADTKEEVRDAVKRTIVEHERG